jgi:hypothetical protein
VDKLDELIVELEKFGDCRCVGCSDKHTAARDAIRAHVSALESRGRCDQLLFDLADSGRAYWSALSSGAPTAFHWGRFTKAEDAIRAYAPVLEQRATDAEATASDLLDQCARLREMYRDQREEWDDLYSDFQRMAHQLEQAAIERDDASKAAAVSCSDYWEDRAETAERERDEALRELDSVANLQLTTERKLAETVRGMTSWYVKNRARARLWKRAAKANRKRYNGARLVCAQLARERDELREKLHVSESAMAHELNRSAALREQATIAERGLALALARLERWESAELITQHTYECEACNSRLCSCKPHQWARVPEGEL